MSNQAIAADLVVTLDTIKKHVGAALFIAAGAAVVKAN
jgi:hypothetical protein